MKSLVFAFSVFLAGCAPSPWERFYQVDGSVKTRIPATATAQVREVPYERVSAFMREFKSMNVSSDVALEDMPEDRKMEMRNRLFETLQLRERGREAGLVGGSEFTYIGEINPRDGSLEQFARSMGADYAVFAVEYLGEHTYTVQTPVLNFSTMAIYGRRGYLGSTVTSDLNYVPSEVTKNRYHYVCFFLRRDLVAIANAARQPVKAAPTSYAPRPEVKSGWESPNTFLTPTPPIH